MIDPVRVKQFWDERAGRGGDDPAVTNLEPDPALQAEKLRLEAARVADYLGALDPASDVLDLGGGTGHWAFTLAPRVRSVHVVDYCAALIERGRARAIPNVTFTHAAAQDFRSPTPFDLIFLSGLLLYLNDDELDALLDAIGTYCRPTTTLILRDATGLPSRFELRDRWSDALQAHYAAIYRTRAEYLAAFARIGFVLVRDDDMFEPGSPLNKWPETRLRIYRFERYSGHGELAAEGDPRQPG